HTQPSLLSRGAEVLLVQQRARDRLYRLLQIEQGKFRRQQLEHHRPVFELAAQATHGGSKNAAMVEFHWPAKIGELHTLERGPAAVARALGDEPGLVEQLVALQHLLLVETSADA